MLYILPHCIRRIGVAFALATVAWPLTVFAAAPVPKTLAEADAQRARATEMRSNADKTLASEQAACYQKFLVNSCLDDAKKKYTKTMIEARELDAPARDFQREANRAEVEAKEKKRDADNAQRAINQQQQAEDYRAKEAERANARERKKASKEEKAAEARAKRAADDERRKKKNEERAKRDAERAERKAQREAKEAAANRLAPPP